MGSLANRDYVFASWLNPFSPPIPPNARKVVPLCVALLPSACRFPAVAARRSPLGDRPAPRASRKALTPLVPGYLRCWQIPAPPGKKVFAWLQSLPRLAHQHSSDRSNPPNACRLNSTLCLTPCLTMYLASKSVFFATHPIANNPQSVPRSRVHPGPAQSSTRDPANSGRVSPAAKLL